jgi:hypothetical protein
MAFRKHAKLQMEGKLNSSLGGPEIWSSGLALSIGLAGGDWLANPQTYVDAIADPLAVWFADSANLIPNNATLEVVKVNNISPDGKYAEPTTHEHIFSPAAVGGAGSQHPSFLSVVTTLEGETARGYAHRGRMYLPNYSPLADGSFISAPQVAAVIAAGRRLLTILSINEPTGGALVSPCIVSKHAGELQDVTAVSCDNIYDFQSRRKNRLKAVRTRVLWP